MVSNSFIYLYCFSRILLPASSSNSPTSSTRWIPASPLSIHPGQSPMTPSASSAAGSSPGGSSLLSLNPLRLEDLSPICCAPEPSPVAAAASPASFSTASPFMQPDPFNSSEQQDQVHPYDAIRVPYNTPGASPMVARRTGVTSTVTSQSVAVKKEDDVALDIAPQTMSLRDFEQRQRHLQQQQQLQQHLQQQLQHPSVNTTVSSPSEEVMFFQPHQLVMPQISELPDLATYAFDEMEELGAAVASSASASVVPIENFSFATEMTAADAASDFLTEEDLFYPSSSSSNEAVIVENFPVTIEEATTFVNQDPLPELGTEPDLQAILDEACLFGSIDPLIPAAKATCWPHQVHQTTLDAGPAVMVEESPAFGMMEELLPYDENVVGGGFDPSPCNAAVVVLSSSPSEDYNVGRQSVTVEESTAYCIEEGLQALDGCEGGDFRDRMETASASEAATRCCSSVTVEQPATFVYESAVSVDSVYGLQVKFFF